MRLLVWFRHQADVVEMIELPIEAEPLLGPGAAHDLQHLGKTLAAFRVGDAIGLIGAGKPLRPTPKISRPWLM